MRYLFAILLGLLSWNASGAFSGPINGSSSGSGIATANGFGTNTTLRGGALSISITNDGSAVVGQTNMYWNIWPLNSGIFSINFGSTAAGGTEFGQLFLNTQHDGGAPSPLQSEWQEAFPHNIAMAPGYQTGAGHLQIGAGNLDSSHVFGGPYMYMQNMSPVNYTNGHSAPIVFKTSAGDNLGSTVTSFYPGFIGRVISTNTTAPTYELCLFPDLNNTGGISTGADDGKFDARTLGTNGLRLQWSGGNKVIAHVDGNLAVSNNITVKGSADFGFTGTAADLSIIAGGHAVIVGNGSDGDLSVKTAGFGTIFRSSVGNNYNAFPGTIGVVIGKLESVTNSLLEVNGRIQAEAGYRSMTNTAVASAAITFPASTVKFTNTFGLNIVMYIDNTGVTGTTLSKNNQQIFSSLVGDMTVLMKPGDYFAETYTVGTPSARWEPQ